MSFFEQKKKIEESRSRENLKSLESYDKEFLLTESSISDKIRERSLEYLYCDLVNKEIDYDFRPSLGNGEYHSAKSEALSCLVISLKAKDLNPRKLPDWLEHSQKSFDYLIAKYISDGLVEKVSKQKGRDYETDIYYHLENKEDEKHREIGSKFRSIYQYRSQMKHIHYTDDNGYRRIKTISNKKYREYKSIVLEFYKNSLTVFLPLYKKVFAAAEQH